MSWRRFFRRAQVDAEQRQELESYLEITTEEYIARGMNREAARQAARRKLGSPTLIREEIYRMNTMGFLDALGRDLRYALRSMRRSPAFTAIAIVTLAIGIGANTAIFSIINGVLLKPLPYPDSDRLITMSHSLPNIPDVRSAPFLYFTEREQNQTLEGVGLVGEGGGSVTGRGEPEQIKLLIVTSDILPILGIEPLLGRKFSEEDQVPGGPNTIILTYGYWQRRFGGDPAAVGQSLTMDGQQSFIIGIMPRRFRSIGGPVDAISPLRLNRNRATVGNYFSRSIARLKPGVTIEQATTDVKRMIPIAVDSFPLGPGISNEQRRNIGLAPKLRPLKQDVVGDVGGTLWVLMGTIGMVLLIACANVANLILVRTEARQEELSIRVALGAGWGQISRGLLTESAALSLVGGALGVGFAYIGLRVLLAAAPANLPRVGEIAIDPPTLLFALGLSVLSCLFFGAIPAARYGRPRLARALQLGARSSSPSRERLQTRGILVVVQVAFAVVLLISAGLMIRTFRELNNVNPGFANPSEVQTMQIDFPLPRVLDAELAVRKENEILDRIAALPGVRAVGYTSAVPLDGGATAELLFPEGKTFSATSPPKSGQTRFISPGLFATLGIPLVAGRDFTWNDIYGRRPVVLVSENLARQEWGSPEGALGKQLRSTSPTDQWREIIGVVGEVHDRGLNQPVTETLYGPVLMERFHQMPIYYWGHLTYAVRSPRTGTPGFIDEIRKAVWAVDSNLPLSNIRTMSDILDESLARTSFTLLMLAIAGTMALLLGVIGIYGVISYTVSQRVREIGIRIALGAQGGEVLGMFVRQGVALTTIGVAAGLAGAVALTRSMSSLLFGVAPIDPVTYAGTAMILLAAAVAASYIPARRAASVDPIDTLRGE